MSLSKSFAIVLFLPSLLAAQVPAVPPTSDSVVAIKPPANPLPPEGATGSIRKFSFIAYGDTRGRHDGTQLQAEHQLVMEEMLNTIRRQAAAGDPIKFVLQSGDAVVNGAQARQLNVSYVPIIEKLTGENVPYFLSVGNHDVGSSPDPASPMRMDGLRNFFAANAKLIPPEGSPRRLNGFPTYAFGYGNSFFIAFDSNIPDEEAQFQWVKQQLEGLDRRRYVNIVVFFHHPPFSSGPHGGARLESQAASIRAKWMPLFHKHHVRLLLTGHEHLFEHWVEWYTDSTGLHRLDQVVTGGGGAPLYRYTGEPDLVPYLRENAALKVSLDHIAKPSVDPGGNPFHFTVVHVDGASLSIEVVGVDWGRGFAPYRSSSAPMVEKRP